MACLSVFLFAIVCFCVCPFACLFVCCVCCNKNLSFRCMYESVGDPNGGSGFVLNNLLILAN